MTTKTLIRIGTSHRRYAKALMLLTSAKGDHNVLLADLRKIEEAMAASSVLREVLSSPLVEKLRKEAICRDVAGMLKLGSNTLKAWQLIVGRGRSGELPGIIWQFERLIDEIEGKARATVTSAAKLPLVKQAQVKRVLSEYSGKDVQCVFEEDPELLGGLTARLGNQLFDGSIRGQLDRLRRDWLGD